MSKVPVKPAKASTQTPSPNCSLADWAPAFAGVTVTS